MAKKTDRNHYIAKVQTKPWLDGNQLHFVDTEKDMIPDHKHQETLFMEWQVFPQILEDFLCGKIETFLNDYRKNDSLDIKSLKMYNSLWFLFILNGFRIQRGRDKKESMENAHLQIFLAGLEQHAETMIKSQTDKGLSIAKFKSEKSLFFSDTCLFAIPYSSNGVQLDTCALGFSLDRNTAIVYLYRQDFQLVQNQILKNPEFLRRCSISYTAKKIVFHKDDQELMGTAQLMEYIKNVKQDNQRLIDTINLLNENNK